MNPTFKPPPPVSDAVKTAIYEAFMQDPIKNNVRSLSQIHHLSLKRVDAILRLKGMENAWIKVSMFPSFHFHWCAVTRDNDDSKID